ncbi:FAD-dependent oxidoreductase [Qiania dongpingensis]|uniref:FAD-dependent oxidoreductase n=1 Tax=Qiania dongpingensis TaxID=2763669 RepID=A0A7G9G0H8_9FIRM|nr:FAD-dependent oxidoreductase [Qiania dongpingensis]QNM04310.1 FAD-dependent oxidoreductase [Qiania dongpingensis]
MDSIWTKTKELPKRQTLTEDLKTDAAVIGGGMAGILTAYLLEESGIRTVVLEASRIGSGQTKNTTAKITSQHGLIYDKLLTSFGDEKASQYAQANEKAIREYRRIISYKNISCHFKDTSAYLYSLKEAEPLKKEAEAAKQAGIDACFTTETELPFKVEGAVCFKNQAKFHPLEFLGAAAEELTVFENSRVFDVDKHQVRTANGSVTAENIIFATHYPFLNVPGYYFMRMHQERSYVLALEGASLPEGMYLGIDKNGLSFRSEEELLLFGGAGHRTGENRKGKQYDLLRKQARTFWPECREKAHWSAQDCMTLDGLPYIGTFSSETPNWYAATGFGKWGMTFSMVSAMIIRDKILGRRNPASDLFSPQRFTPSASARTFLDDGLHAVRDLSRQLFSPPRDKTDALPKGHGGIVEYDGKKAGVYKDENGELHVVSPKCPHLGCQLEWNPDEKSWDCPCHGSRFDYEGHLIDNPAQEGLKHV